MPSLAAKAEGRINNATDSARDLLADGSARAAVNFAISKLQAELAKVRRQRPGDAALIDADLAGSLLAIAAQLHKHKPVRPAGIPRVPRPEHLLAAFDASYERAEEEGTQ